MKKAKITNSVEAGFTLVEVMIVVIVMALLTVIALPKIFNIIRTAQFANRNNSVASIRSGIALNKTSSISESSPTGSYPTSLDAASNAPCTSSNICFTTILEAGHRVHDYNWNRNSDFSYTYDGTSWTSDWEYNNVNGTFLCVSGSCTN